MATLRERKHYRKAVMRVLYVAVAGNQPGLSGAALRDKVRLSDEDLAAACTYLAEEGLISVEWTQHRTPATVTLTHDGIRLMEAEEEERG